MTSRSEKLVTSEQVVSLLTPIPPQAGLVVPSDGFVIPNVGVNEDFCCFAFSFGSFFFVSDGRGSFFLTTTMSPRDGQSLVRLVVSTLGDFLVSIENMMNYSKLIELVLYQIFNLFLRTWDYSISSFLKRNQYLEAIWLTSVACLLVVALDCWYSGHLSLFQRSFDDSFLISQYK